MVGKTLNAWGTSEGINAVVLSSHRYITSTAENKTETFQPDMNILTPHLSGLIPWRILQ